MREKGALRAHQHSNPITDCAHRTAREGENRAEEEEREKKEWSSPSVVVSSMS